MDSICSHQSSQRTNQALALSGLLFITAVWGLSFLLIKWTVIELDGTYFIFVRFTLAALVMLALFPKQIARATRATMRSSIMLGTLLSAVFIFQTEGLRFTDAANSSLITSSNMVLIPVFLFLGFRRRISLSNIIGIALAFGGMYLLTNNGLHRANVGDLLTIACSVALAWHTILTGRYTTKHPLLPLVTYQFVTVAGISGLIALVRGGMSLHLNAIAIATLLFTAIMATVVALVVQTHAQKIIAPERIGVIFTMEAVFGILFAWTIGKESPTILSIVGAGFMIAGILISEIAAALTTTSPAKAIYIAD